MQFPYVAVAKMTYSIASQENTLLQHIGLFIQVLVYLVYLHSNINFSSYFPDC